MGDPRAKGRITAISLQSLRPFNMTPRSTISLIVGSFMLVACLVTVVHNRSTPLEVHDDTQDTALAASSSADAVPTITATVASQLSGPSQQPTKSPTESFDKVVEDLVKLNPSLSATKLKSGVKVDPKDPSRVIGDLWWNSLGIKALPANFGVLKVSGSFILHSNQLTSLPSSFANLKVGGALDLNFNKLTSLPSNFGNLRVGGGLELQYNQLTSLLESFGNLKVGNGLDLSNNKLTSLPSSFGNLKVGGSLFLSFNQLTSLPSSFGNIKIGGNLDLNGNPHVADALHKFRFPNVKGQVNCVDCGR